MDLTALARDVVARLRETGADREVEVRIEPDLSTQGGGALLRQVLENLLGNAWRFSSRRPLARIAFIREQDSGTQAVFLVEDNGEGFDDDRAANLSPALQPPPRLPRQPGDVCRAAAEPPFPTPIAAPARRARRAALRRLMPSGTGHRRSKKAGPPTGRPP